MGHGSLDVAFQWSGATYAQQRFFVEHNCFTKMRDCSPWDCSCVKAQAIDMELAKAGTADLYDLTRDRLKQWLDSELCSTQVEYSVTQPETSIGCSDAECSCNKIAELAEEKLIIPSHCRPSPPAVCHAVAETGLQCQGERVHTVHK